MSESTLNPGDKTLNFSSFIISYVSLSVIAGLFTYRLLITKNTLYENQRHITIKRK